MLLLVAALALGAYVVYARSAGSAGPEAAAATPDRWTSLFDGQRPETVGTPNGGLLEMLPASATVAQPVLRFTPAPTEGSFVVVSIGQGVISRLQGTNVEVQVTIASPATGPSVVEVRCRIGGAEACAPQTFDAVPEAKVFAFTMRVPADAAEGSIEIRRPPGAAPARLDLYSARLRAV